MNRLVMMLAVAACVDKGPGSQGKKIESSYIANNLVKEVPPSVEHLDVDLGGKVVYAGSSIDHPSVAPGQPVRVTHYWQVKQPVGPDWRVFAFLRGAPGTADFMNLPATDMEIGHPPDKWKAGEVVQDVMDIVLRPDWRSPQATLYVGLIHTGGHDVGDRMSASGPKVVDRAVVARAIDVDLSKAPPPPGTVYVPHAAGPINIDGVPMDPGWTTAVMSPEFQTAEGCPEPAGKALARMTWDDQFLYVYASITDPDVVNQYKNHDDPIYKEDALEIFIDADGNRRGYVELQVAPTNATFDSWFARTHAEQGPGDEKWDSGMIAVVKVRGTAEGGDTDQGWDAEIAIPWPAVKGRDDAMAVRLPPQVGDRWRMNIVRTDIKTGGKPFSGGATSWNRITCADFHAPDRMLNIVFADQGGSIVPGAQPAAGSAAAPGTGSAAATGSGSGAMMLRTGGIQLVPSPPPSPAGSGSAK